LFELLQIRNSPAPGAEAVQDIVPVNGRGGGIKLIARSSVLYLQARGDYVRVVADGGRFLVRSRITSFERSWAPFGFVRVHRGYLVNLRRVAELRPRPGGTGVLLLDDGEELPVARRKRPELRRLLGL
jgi:two-component system, LytTR family, response regulator